MSIQTKNSQTEADSQLRQVLKNLHHQLFLTGVSRIVLTEGADQRILAASDPHIAKGDPVDIRPSPFEIFSEKALVSPHASLIYEESPRLMLLEMGSFIFNYLLLAVGLFLVGLIFLRKKSQEIPLQVQGPSATMSWIHESAEPALILTDTGEILDLNTSASLLFNVPVNELIHKNLFDEGSLPFQITSLEGSLALSPLSLRRSDPSRGKIKVQMSSEAFRYVSYSCSPLTEKNGYLVLLHDLTLEIIREQELTHTKSALLEKNEILEQQIITDPLTKTLNRFYLHHFLDSKNLRWLKSEGASLLAIDLDGFKELNDSRGHIFGDTVLRSFGLFLRSFFRRSDKIIRTGGDEFLVILPSVQLKEAARIAQNLIDALRKTPLDSETRITVSVGVAQLDKAESARDWLERADAALYDAKRSGKNTYCTQTNESLEILES